MSRRFAEIESVKDLLERGGDLRDCILQGLDCRGLDLDQAEVGGAVFLGCRFDETGIMLDLQRRGAVMFPEFQGLPYQPYRSGLYTWQELMDVEEGGKSRDLRIYGHAHAHRQAEHPCIMECLAQRIHDHSIDDALAELLHGRKRVGIMGGHGTPRTDPVFADVVRLARDLCRAGYFVVSGGGPGIMEAANLGAWLAPQPPEAVDEALALLAAAPRYTDPGYLEGARAVLERFPEGAESLAIPTWFYGHEPSNLFASHIAKYFANSLREDGLLAIALHGVIYAPGSAGTLQEVFMDLCQNHYATFEYVSPMVFLGSDTWRDRIPVWAFLDSFCRDRGYREYIALLDDPAEVLDFIREHPPARPADLG